MLSLRSMNAAFVTLCADAAHVESVNAIKPGLIGIFDKNYPITGQRNILHPYSRLSVFIGVIIAITEI